jgi:ABC-type transporter Mla MlaB component
MLRILVFEEYSSVKLRLEGKLTEKTVPLLSKRWAEVRSRLKGRKAILDLGDVVQIDETGRRTLAWLARSGVKFGYAHPTVRPILEDLACAQSDASRFSAGLWKRLNVRDCNEHWDSPIYRVCRLICWLLPRALQPCGCAHAENDLEKPRA